MLRRGETLCGWGKENNNPNTIMAKLKAKKMRFLYTAHYNQQHQKGGSMNFPVYRAYRGRGGKRGWWKSVRSLGKRALKAIAPHAKKIGKKMASNLLEKGYSEGKKVLAGEKKIGSALKSLARDTASNLGTSTLKALTGGQRRKRATTTRKKKKSKSTQKQRAKKQRGGRRVAKKGVKRVGRKKQPLSDVFAQAARLGGKKKW